MSRSKLHNPCIKISGNSDKKDRTLANKKFRRISKIKLNNANEEDIPVHLREVSNTWSFNSDGLAHYLSRFVNSKRKEDKEQLKIFMRK